MLTLVAPLGRSSPTPLAAGYRSRPSDVSDLESLAVLYFDAYDPGIASDTYEDALADIQASFDGDYGEYMFEASAVVEHESEIVAAIMVVRRAPWENTPDCPFIIELFTSRGHRRFGLGRHLLTACMETLIATGEEAVALRVSSENRQAMHLYRSLHFMDYQPKG